MKKCQVVNRVPIIGSVDHAALAQALQANLSGATASAMEEFFDELADEFLASEECATAVGEMALVVSQPSEVVTGSSSTRPTFPPTVSNVGFCDRMATAGERDFAG